MAYTTADRPIRSGAGLTTLVQAGRSVASFLATIGAAIRVANAVEARRDASAEDLKILGISGQLPRRF